jgi:hypothetical protein
MKTGSSVYKISVITTLGSSSTEGNDITIKELNIFKTLLFIWLSYAGLSIKALIMRKKFCLLCQLSCSTDKKIVGSKASRLRIS